MNGLAQDLRFALHLFRKSPGFALAAILTLALGIGCNVGVFSFVYAWILTPAPFAHAERIVLIRLEHRLQKWAGDLSPADLLDLRDASSPVLQPIAAFDLTGFNLSGAGLPPERVQGARASPEFFNIFDARPAMGRAFLPEDANKAGDSKVAIISDGIWKRRYAGDPGIIGRNIRLDGGDYRVIGVMPARFHIPVMGALSVWTPLVYDPRDKQNRADRSIAVFARLRPGIRLEQARANLDGLARDLAHRFPASHANLGFRVLTYPQAVARQSGENGIRVLFYVVACLLLIACTNVANLILARSVNRRREVAIRLALGVSQWRLTRQLLTENLLLFLAGGLLSLLLANWMMRGSASRLPETLLGYLPNYGQVHLNCPVLAYTLALVLLTGIVFSLGPVLRLTKVDLHEVLKETSRASAGMKRLGRWRYLLVIGEIAMTLTVSIIAGVLCRDLIAIYDFNKTFDTHHVFLGRLSPPANRYSSDDQIRHFFDQLLLRSSALPEAGSVAIAEAPPFTGLSERVQFSIDGRESRHEDVPSALVNPVSSGYLHVLGLRLIQGSGIEQQDREGRPYVAVVNQSFARRYFPNQDAVGHTLHLSGGTRAPVRIVGIVEDSMQFEPSGTTEPLMLTSYRQFPVRDMYLLFRASPNADSSAPQAMLKTAAALDRDLAFERIASLDTLMEEQMAAHRLMTIWMAGFAILALVLSIVGIYGLLSYIAENRTREFGIRMALGATATDILRQVATRGVILVLPGLVLGVVETYAISFLVRAIVAKVSPTDSAALAGATLLFALAAFVACIVPALRAAHIEPLFALRHE